MLRNLTLLLIFIGKCHFTLGLTELNYSIFEHPLFVEDK